MKIRSTLLVMTVLLLAALTFSKAFAVDVILNGKKLKLDSQPRFKKQLLFVPLRGIFEKMGASVKFVKAEKKVVAVRGKTKIVLVLDKNEAKVNGESKRMFQPPFEKNGRTYVPLRFLSEALGCTVKWHPPTKTVGISTKKGKDPFEGMFEDETASKKKTPMKIDSKIDSKIDGIGDIEPIETKKPEEEKEVDPFED